MSETVVYMRGNFPFPIDRLVTPDLVEDLRNLLATDADALNAACQSLEGHAGFLDEATIKSLALKCISNEVQSASVARLIITLDARARSTGMGIDDVLSSIADWQKGKENAEKKQLTPGDVEELGRRLPLLVRPLQGLKRQVKAERLSGIVGLLLENLEVICDLRPVFDDDKSHVEGVIPFTILKVVCRGPAGLPVALEAVLSEKAVTNLATKANDAVKKLRHLRELLAEKSLPIPSLELTKQGE